MSYTKKLAKTPIINSKHDLKLFDQLITLIQTRGYNLSMADLGYINLSTDDETPDAAIELDFRDGSTGDDVIRVELRDFTYATPEEKEQYHLAHFNTAKQAMERVDALMDLCRRSGHNQPPSIFRFAKKSLDVISVRK